MTATSATSRDDTLAIRPALLGLGIVVAEVLLVTGYLSLSSTTVTQPRYVIYPFIWINVGLWAVYAGAPRVGNERHRLVGVAVAGAYYLVLLAVAGNVVFGAFVEPYLSIIWATPGWGPVLNGSLPGIEIHLVPYEVIGYAGLSYLFYANVLEISRGLLSGVLGIVTCVSCTMPFWGPVFGLLGGSAMGLTGLATTYAYDIGTVIFLLTIGLLYYFQSRPDPDVSTAELA